MIFYRDNVEDIEPEQIGGFFVEWPNPPDPETHLRILEGSSDVIVAIDDESRHVVGFITAISDGILSASIPLLEVLPNWQGRGIGQELVRRIQEQLRDLYMIDLLCDEEFQPWYEWLGFMRSQGMALRNYANLCGKRVTESL